jgi:hypothetical protein
MSEKLDRDDPDVRKMVERQMLACLDEEKRSKPS